MINFSSLYEELLKSEKIRYGSKILNIFFQNNTTVSFDSKIVIDNEYHLVKLKVCFQSVIYNNSDKNFFDFLDDLYDYDVILISNMFSFCEKEQINEILEILQNKNLNAHYMFANEMICDSSVVKYHPFSYIRNLLYQISNYNFGKNIHITDVYDIINSNNLKILDTSRILSNSIIPAYPIEYFLIVSHERYYVK